MMHKNEEGTRREIRGWHREGKMVHTRVPGKKNRINKEVERGVLLDRGAGRFNATLEE